MKARFVSVLLLPLFALQGFCQPPSKEAPPPRPEGVRPLPEKMPPPAEVPPPLPGPPLGPIFPDGCAPPIIEKTIPHIQVLLVPHESATTMPAWKLRDVDLGCAPGGPVLDFHEEKQVVTEMVLKERQIDQQVVCDETRPVTVTDCMGHCHTEYQLCPVVKVVKVTVFEPVPEQRIVLVRVPYLKPGPPLKVQKVAVDEITVPAIERRFEVITTPNEITVHVPAPVCPIPPPPACPVGVHD